MGSNPSTEEERRLERSLGRSRGEKDFRRGFEKTDPICSARPPLYIICLSRCPQSLRNFLK